MYMHIYIYIHKCIYIYTHAPGTPGMPLGTPGTSMRPPGDAPGTPGGPRGPLMDHKNDYIRTNIQRQKVLIAVFEPARWDPSPEGSAWTVLSIKWPPK